jgi:hypothetical protein
MRGSQKKYSNRVLHFVECVGAVVRISVVTRTA